MSIIQVSDTQRIEVEGKKFIPIQHDGSFWCAFPSGQPKLSKSFRTEQEARDFLALQVEQKSSEIGTLKYEYPEWERGLPPMPAPPEQG